MRIFIQLDDLYVPNLHILEPILLDLIGMVTAITEHTNALQHKIYLVSALPKPDKNLAVEWIHPDIFATYLSHEGHPTPLASDFRRFCSAGSIGLLFIQSAQTLFTLDCKNFKLLQHTTSITDDTTVKLPFYSRVPEIRADWWGEGSSKLQHYHPHYLQLLVLNNTNNKELYSLIKEKFGATTPLLQNFNFKE